MNTGIIIRCICIVVLFLVSGMRESNTIVCVAPDKTFKNPLLQSGADPWVVYHNKQYYVTHSAGDRLKLYRTASMSKLGEAESKVVWTPPQTGMNSREIWAPEIHHVNGKWYFYYAADDGDNNNHRMWVLENSAADPFTGIWVDKGKLNLPDDRWAIDGTIFEHKGTLYFLWSGWEGPTNVRQDIYITKMLNPWTADDKRIRLSKPELSWETKGTSKDLPTVNEGPQFLSHNGKVFIIYSASGCWTDDYSLGILTADAKADLMDAGVWVKSPQPVFQKNPEGKAFGPGHNGFFKSPNGREDWIIYHANPESGQGCNRFRSTRMQQFTWNKNGMPVFDVPVPLDKPITVPSGD
jgi:GH43 family beta-xylosidase